MACSAPTKRRCSIFTERCSSRSPRGTEAAHDRRVPVRRPQEEGGGKNGGRPRRRRNGPTGCGAGASGGERQRHVPGQRSDRRGGRRGAGKRRDGGARSEEHTSELQSLMRISYDVFCLKKKKTHHRNDT